MGLSNDIQKTFEMKAKKRLRNDIEVFSEKKKCLTQQKNDNHVLSRRRLLENSLTIIRISLHRKKIP